MIILRLSSRDVNSCKSHRIVASQRIVASVASSPGSPGRDGREGPSLELGGAEAVCRARVQPGAYSASKTDTLHACRQAAQFMNTPGAGEEAVRKVRHALRPAQRWLHPHRPCGLQQGGGPEQAVIELIGSGLVSRAADGTTRRVERLTAMREGKEGEGGAE